MKELKFPMKNWNYFLQAMDLPFVRASRINCIVRSLQLKMYTYLKHCKKTWIEGDHVPRNVHFSTTIYNIPNLLKSSTSVDLLHHVMKKLTPPACFFQDLHM
jgi:hypothetical protein